MIHIFYQSNTLLCMFFCVYKHVHVCMPLDACTSHVEVKGEHWVLFFFCLFPWDNCEFQLLISQVVLALPFFCLFFCNKNFPKIMYKRTSNEQLPVTCKVRLDKN